MSVNSTRFRGWGFALLSLASASAVQATNLPPLPESVPVTDLPDYVFRSPREIRGWIAGDRRDQMKRHAWDLFTAAMMPRYDNNGATIRLFDTWHSLDEIIPAVGEPVVGFDSERGRVRSRSQIGRLGPAGQMTHGLKPDPSRAALTLSDAVVSDVKYNPAIGRMIENDLEIKTRSPSTGETVVAGYNLRHRVVPGQAEAIPLEDTHAVMIKPAFTIVKGKGPTVIARWDESPNVVNPRSVETHELPVNANRVIGAERTWTQEAVVYPSERSRWRGPVTYYGRNGAPIAKPYNFDSLPKFNLTDFHYVKLNEAQVQMMKTGILMELVGPNVDNIEVGDYAVMTSMHISTREVDDWTWQTFWWQPSGGEPLSANGASLMQQVLFAVDPAYKPLKYFRAGVGYSYTDRMGRGVINSNPYLESSFGLPIDLATVFGPDAKTDGVNVLLRNANDQPLTHNGVSYVHAPPYGLRTNCITCHRAAAYPTDSLGRLPAGTRGNQPDWGKLEGTEDLFVDRVKTHFLWGVANKITAREADALAAGMTLP